MTQSGRHIYYDALLVHVLCQRLAKQTDGVEEAANDEEP